MPRQENQKAKLLTLLDILRRETDGDEGHRLTVPQIIEELEKEGIPCERKSVYNDILTLQALGYDIKRNGGYYYCPGQNDLNISELKMLADAVQASRFIPDLQSEKLVRKLGRLCSRYQADKLRRQVYFSGRRKANETALRVIDPIYDGIENNYMLKIRYGNFERVISPWYLVWDNGYYYLIAYQEYDQKKGPGARIYRLDRMQDVAPYPSSKAASPRRGQKIFDSIRLSDFLTRHFNMWSGPEYNVVIRFRNSDKTREAMQDRFGQQILIVPEDDDWAHFSFTVCVSDPFYGWVSSFGGDVTLAGPEEVREGYRAFLCKQLELLV